MSIWGRPICGDYSLKFKFVTVWEFFALLALSLALPADGSKRFQTMDPL